MTSEICCAPTPAVALAQPQMPGAVQAKFVLPKAGLVYSEKGGLNEILCKPKLLPIKSAELQRLEGMEKQMASAASAAAAGGAGAGKKAGPASAATGVAR